MNFIKLKGKFIEELYEGRVSKLWLFETSDNARLVISTLKNIEVFKGVEYQVTARLEAVAKELDDARMIYRNNAYAEQIEEVEGVAEVDNVL